MHENKTWELVKKPQGVNIVGCKWVFKMKPSSNGIIFKIRFVANGYSQQEGLDFIETFSPVVRYDYIRIILPIAAIKDLKIVQFDVKKTAFLNGDLNDRNLVCCLKKSRYDLKQAPKIWNEKFITFLKEFNMIQSDEDNCVFRGTTGNEKVVLLLYLC